MAETIKVGGGGAGSRVLGLIPVLVAVTALPLMMPRAAGAEAVPLPIVDERVLDSAAARDRELAAAAQRDALPGVVRALGSAIRAFNKSQAEDAEAAVLGKEKDALEAALAPALAEGPGKLVALRALQTETFLAELRRFEQTGKESEELAAVGGGFVRRMRFAGWCDAKGRLALTELERRVVFKAAWNSLLALDAHPQLALALDETRALYALFLRLPHAAEQMRADLETARAGHPDSKTCADLALRERVAVEAWRLEKIKKLGTLDPTYPVDYAVGVAEYRRGQYPAATTAFKRWLASHPDGPFTLRARNHLKAAIDLTGF